MNWYLRKKAQGQLIDMQAKEIPIPAAKKSKINSKIYQVTMNTKPQIPLQDIFDAMQEQGVVAVQEDGTLWDGMIMGTKECGTDGASEQKASIDLAMQDERGVFAPTRSVLYMNWCTKNIPSGGMVYETTAYVT